VVAEEAARIAADTALQGGLDAEAATRATNDTAEANARLAADTAETNARITADAAEVSARIAADNALLPKPGGGVTWTSGAAAPTSTQPIGSLYSRTGGAVGATLYVSRGSGTWAAVAGV
jgi:sRNA-binding protein